MDMLMKVLPALLAIVLGAALLEGVIKSRLGRRYDWRAYWSSLGDLIGRRVMEALPFSLTASMFAVVWQHRLFTVSMTHWWSWLLLFVGEEFCYYWYHRTSHTVRWFWATHAVHHSPNEISFATAYRLGWTGKLTGTPLFFLPLVLLGFSPLMVLAAVGINLLYQFWLHADWIPKLGYLEWVLNTPSHHRVHHASNPEYLDANYGGVVIVFDRLFNTCREEREDLPCRYGLVNPVTSYNPLRIALFEWQALLSDLGRARNWRERFGYLFGPPGWSPDGQGHTTEALRRNARQLNADYSAAS
jgi:sterol desaturase/sphingolipid hydroxylase (fatty acid hydroxylase superfamily)